MADSEIGALTEVAEAQASDIWHIVQGGNSRKVTTAKVAAFVEKDYSNVGKALLAATDESAAQDAIGATAVGKAVLVATDESAAQDAIGATAVGKAVLVATDASAGRAAIDLGTTNLFIKAAKREVALVRKALGAVSLKAGTIVEVDGKIFTYATDEAITMPTLTAGDDVAFWIKPDGQPVGTLDFSTPPVAGSRLIGGGHYAPGGNATANSGGDATPQFNPYSLWDEKFRPRCADARGMALIADNFWCDIYLLGANHQVNGTSRFNVSIADGSTPPKIPVMFGGDGSAVYSTLTRYEAAEVVLSHGKDLLSPGEFAAMAFGTTEATSGGTDPGNTILRQAFTSKWGIMLATGNIWVWGRDFGGDFGAAEYVDQGRGSAHTLSTAVFLGGSWSNAAASGSRASVWNALPSLSSDVLGARGRCEHLILD